MHCIANQSSGLFHHFKSLVGPACHCNVMSGTAIRSSLSVQAHCCLPDYCGYQPVCTQLWPIIAVSAWIWLCGKTRTGCSYSDQLGSFKTATSAQAVCKRALLLGGLQFMFIGSFYHEVVVVQVHISHDS